MVELNISNNIDEKYLKLDEKKYKDLEEFLTFIVDYCFDVEKIDKEKMVIEINVETQEIVKQLNHEFRQIDATTDVLSFPMFEKDELQQSYINKKIDNVEILGTLVINPQRVYEQSIEYNHSFKRELSYMVVHGFYHLLGYDHIEEEDKKQMRTKEENILNNLKITRED